MMSVYGMTDFSLPRTLPRTFKKANNEANVNIPIPIFVVVLTFCPAHAETKLGIILNIKPAKYANDILLFINKIITHNLLDEVKGCCFCSALLLVPL